MSIFITVLPIFILGLIIHLSFMHFVIYDSIILKDGPAPKNSFDDLFCSIRGPPHFRRFTVLNQLRCWPAVRKLRSLLFNPIHLSTFLILINCKNLGFGHNCISAKVNQKTFMGSFAYIFAPLSVLKSPVN